MSPLRAPRVHGVVAPLGRRGYVMLVVLVLLALIGVIGATSLSIAGVDQRIANHNRKHMVVFNTSAAGTEHARNELETKNPLSEGLDTGIDSADDFVTAIAADTKFGEDGDRPVHDDRCERDRGRDHRDDPESGLRQL